MKLINTLLRENAAGNAGQNPKMEKENILNKSAYRANSMVINQLEEANYSTAYFDLYPSTQGGLRHITIIVELKKVRIKLPWFISQNTLDYILNLVSAKLPAKPEIKEEDDYRADANEDFGFELFKMLDEANCRFSFQEDWISPRGDVYLKATAFFTRGKIHFSIKRTLEVKQYLEEHGFTIKRTFNLPEEKGEGGAAADWLRSWWPCS